MFAKDFDKIGLDDLQALVSGGISEGRQLEFKRDHYKRTDDGRKEFAADVSSMANASGGVLLIGIAEKNGVASDLVGVSSDNPDQLVTAINDSIRTSIEPQIFGIRVRWIPMDNDRGAILIRIPKSWDAPHRIVVAKDNRFFIRDENGKHAMNVEELRRSFLFATEIEQRVRSFRQERLKILSLNEGPLALADDGPRIILHIVPQVAFTEGSQILVGPSQAYIGLLSGGGGNFLYSIDGCVTYSGPEEKFQAVRSFTTLFRSGIVEACERINTSSKDGIRSIPLTGIERNVIGWVPNSLSKLRQENVPGPYFIMLSLTHVRGISAPPDHWTSRLLYPYRSDSLLLPEIEISVEDSAKKMEEILRPLFDLMWNAFGQFGSPNYKADGSYEWR